MIYFIGNKEINFVKIGYTRDVDRRLKGLQTSCPFELSVFKIEPGGQSIEDRFHKKFDNQHVRGEWFKLLGPIQDYLDIGIDMTRYQQDSKVMQYQLVCELYEKGTKETQISRELDMDLILVRNTIIKYQREQVIKDKLNQRLLSKLKS